MHKRTLVGLAVALLLAAATITVGLVKAPEAKAWSSAGTLSIFEHSGSAWNKVGTLQVEYHDVSEGDYDHAYTFHALSTNDQMRWTTIHFCYLAYNRGPCTNQVNKDEGWYAWWADTTVTNACAHYNCQPGAGYKPWRAEGKICNNWKWSRAWMESDGGSGDHYMDNWQTNIDDGYCAP